MSWTYSAWDEQTTAAARLSMLRQHITEVADKFGPSTSGADMNVDRSELRQYLADLRVERDKLMADPSLSIGGGISTVDYQNPR